MTTTIKSCNSHSSWKNISPEQGYAGLLHREKLEAIAGHLSMIAGFKMEYRDVTEEQLPVLQTYCFSFLLGMCEKEDWNSLEKVKGVVDGLTDLEGNTVFIKYIKEGDEEHCLKKIEGILEQKGLAHSLANSHLEEILLVALKVDRSDCFINALLDKNCVKILSTDHKGRIPIHIAVKRNRVELLEKLMPKTLSGNVLPQIPYSSRKHKVNLCPIALAVQKGHIESLDKLVKLSRISFTEIRIGPDNMTVLHWVILMGQSRMLEHLLTKYPDQVRSLIDLRDGIGRPPIILTTILGDIPSLSILIKNGVNLNSCDFKGQTAMHHAVIQKHKAICEILIREGGDMHAYDLSEKTPVLCDDKEDALFSVWLRKFFSEEAYLNKHYFDNYHVNPPENIVFQGGGPAGITHLGAIRVLEREGMLRHVKRFGGTSAGAITATLASLGLNAKELEELMIATPGAYLLDHPFTQERIEKWVQDHISLSALKEVGGAVSKCVENGSPMPLLKAIGLKSLQSMWRSTGLCAGRRFLDWMEAEIEKRTGIAYCTFGEFAALIAQGKKNPQGRPLRHLHVFATRIGTDAKVERFSSEDFLEDSENKFLIMSEAVGASMSIPIAFQSRVLIYKKPTEDGRFVFYTRHGTCKSYDYNSLSEDLRKSEHIAEPSYVDGGLIYNFPIRAFDQSRFVSGFSDKENYEVINYRTLGFSLYSPKKEAVIKQAAAETLGDVVGGVLGVLHDIEGILDQQAANEKRVIALDKQDIGLTEFGANSQEGKGKRAIEGAEKKTEQFFQKQKKEVAGVLKSEPIEENRVIALEPDPALVMIPPPNEEEKELELNDPADSAMDRFMLRHGMVRTNLGEAFGVGLAGPFFGTVKSIQMVADPIGYERDARWHNFRVLTHRNPQLQLFQHLNDGSVPCVVDHCFDKHRSFYLHPQFSPKVVPHLVFSNEASPIKYLSEQGIPVNVRLEDGTPLVHDLVPYHCDHSFEALVVAHDYQDQALDAAGNTVLHRVAESGNLTAYEILKKHQKIHPVLNVRNSAQKTAILVAGILKHIQLVMLLLEHVGIDLTAIEPETGKTLLHHFAAADEEAAFVKLIQKAKDMGSLDALITAENRLEDSILFATENNTILKLLIENGIDLAKTQPETRKTLLYILSKNNQLELVNLFCQKLRKNHPRAYYSVLDQQVCSSQIDSTSSEPRLKTALIIAAEKNNYDIVRALIEAGADFRTRVDGLSPLDYASTTLFRNQSSLILWQAWRGNMQRDLSDAEKFNALLNCLRLNDFEAAEKLIRNKILPFPIPDCRDEKGNGLLLTVLKAEQLTWNQTHVLVRLLVEGEHYDQVNQVDSNRYTPLMYAVNDPITINILLQAKADPNRQNMWGQTALHLTKNTDTITALIKKGANPFITDVNGKTPRDYALLAEERVLYRFLEKCEALYSQKHLSKVR